MDYPVKSALITAFVSKTKDRFHEYNKEKAFAERLKLVSEIEGMTGVEVVFPYEVNDVEQLLKLLKQYQLDIAALNVNVKAEPEFRNGGLTSVDPGIRKKAVSFIKQAKDFAKAVGANKVTCCPLGDGYEFNFNCDYAQMWKYLVETFSEAGSYLTEIPLFVEYKPSETRGRCFIDTGAKSLCLLNDIGIEQMGITIDYGHSKYGGENPAEVVSLIANSRYSYYIHINDNNAKWDWDYMVASHNFLEYVEFLYYLQKYNYNDYMTSDTSPTRWDIKGTFEANTRMTNKIWTKLLSIDKEKFESLIAGGDYLETWKFIEANILSL
ncbi:MAG: sugar phosphate isomerase/epimerase family protein [Planctomycetota bacterium]|jgi:xylose isomerase